MSLFDTIYAHCHLHGRDPSQVSLGKFGTFQSDNLIDKPFGVSYEIYDDKGNIRPVRNWALDAVGKSMLAGYTFAVIMY